MSTRVVASPTALSCKLDGETVILHRDQYYTLNGVASRAWELLNAQPDVQLVYQCLAAEFDVDPQTLREDLSAWLDQMAKRSLLVEAE